MPGSKGSYEGKSYEGKSSGGKQKLKESKFSEGKSAEEKEYEGKIVSRSSKQRRQSSLVLTKNIDYGRMRSIRVSEMVCVTAKGKWEIPNTLVGVLRDPVASSFLIANCESCFSDENICFWLATNELKCLHKMNGAVPPENATKIKELIENIYETYLVDDSSKWLSLPASISNPLMKNRETYDNSYTLFNKAMDKTLQCLNDDILPRFLHSKHFSELRDLYTQVNKKSLAIKIEGGEPEIVTILADVPLGTKKFEVTLEMALRDQFILDLFIEDAESRHCAESILCLRDILLYKLRFDKKHRPLEVKTRAWHIYTEYLIPMSVHEVSLPDTERQKISYLIAKPSRNIFKTVETLCHKLIAHDIWPQFVKSKKYKSIPSVLKQKAKELKKAGVKLSRHQSNKSCSIQ